MKPEESKYYIAMLNQWLIVKQEKKTLDKYLLERGLKRIAIYGMGVYGRHLVRELENTDVCIVYGIDRKQMDPYKDVKIIKPNDVLPDVDVIINSVICQASEVEEIIKNITSAPIIGLDQLIYDSY